MADFEDKDDLYSPQIGPDMPGAPPIERYAPRWDNSPGSPYNPQYGPAFGGSPGSAFHGGGDQAYEQLPGITSGAAPKPWGLNRDQPLYKPPPYQSGFGNMLMRNRPADMSIDQQGQVGVPADSYGYRFKGKGAVAPPGGAGAAPDRSMELQYPAWRLDRYRDT